MSEQINPYILFLELDTAPQKPTYYELLGVQQGEQDEEIIAAGCEDALAKVRRFKPGANARLWASILDEISLARATLTDPEQRQDYDQQLEAGELPEALELVELLGPVECVAACVSSANAEETTESPQSLADQLVPSHLAAGHDVPQAAAIEPVATPVAVPVSTSPQIPVAAEVPHSVSAAPAVEQSGGHPLTESAVGAGLSLEHGVTPKAGRKRSRRKRSSQNRTPLPLIVISGLIVAGGAYALFLAGGGNTEVATRDKEKGRQQAPTTLINRDVPGSNGKSESGENSEQENGNNDEPMRRDPGTGENTLKPLPPDFGKPEPEKPEMEKPEPEKPEPEKPEPEKPEEPEPEKPAAKPLTAQEKAQLKDALSTARLALAERNMDIVTEQFTIATPLARTEAATEALNRLKLMNELVTQFQRMASQAMDSYQSGSEINVGSSTKAVVVEVSLTELTIKAAGMVQTHPRNKLSVGLAMGIADTNFADDVMKPYLKAAYLVTLKTERYHKRAREFWQSGNSASAKIDSEAFDDFLADQYDFE